MGWKDDPVVGNAPVAEPVAAPEPAWKADPVVKEAPSMLDKVGRQVGLTGRALVSGAATLPAMGADVIGHILNLGIDAYNNSQKPSMSDLVTGKKPTLIPRFEPQGQVLEKGLSAAGLPEPETPTENIVYRTNQALAGQGGAIQAGKALASAANPVTAGVGTVLSANAAPQLQAAAGAGVAGGTAHEAGWGPLSEFLASLTGGALTPSAISAAKGIPGLIEPFTAGGQRSIAGNVISSSASSPVAAINAIRNGSSPVPGVTKTLGAVTRDPGLASLERSLSAKPAGSVLQEQYLQNNAARVAELDDLAGTDATLSFAKDARNTITKPQRESALENANLGTVKTTELTGAIKSKNDALVKALQDEGRYRTFTAQQENLAQGGGVKIANESGPGLKGPIAPGQPNNSPELNVGYNGGASNSPSAFPVSGQPRVPGRYTENAQRVAEGESAADTAGAIVKQRKTEKSLLEYQLDSLQKEGYSPLNVTPMLDSLSAAQAAPGLRASTVVQKTLADVREKLASLADANGNVDARDLYTVRKELGNTISVHAKENANWDKKLTSTLEKNIQGHIDEAISKAGAGDLWDQYLLDYRTASRPVNQLEILQGVREKVLGTGEDRMGNRQILPGKMQSTMASIDDVAAAATGFDKAKAESILTPQQSQRLENLRKDMSDAAFSQQGGKVSGSNTVQLANYSTANIIGRIAGGESGPITRNIGRGLDWLNKLNDRDIDRLLIEAVKDPALAGTLMKNASADRVRLASDGLEQLAKAIGIGTAGATTQELASRKSRPAQSQGQGR